MWNQLLDPTPHLFSNLSSHHHPSQYLFEVRPQASFLTVSSISHWSYTLSLMTCCFRSSFRHAVQACLSASKITFWYFMIVSLIASSSSSFVFIERVYSTFLQFLTSTSCSFIINLQAGYKSLFLHLKKSIIIVAQHVTLPVFCISVFTLFNIYLRIIIFNLFVDRIDL